MALERMKVPSCVYVSVCLSFWKCSSFDGEFVRTLFLASLRARLSLELRRSSMMRRS